MQEMQNNIDNKDLAKLLSKELITLELSIADDLPLKNDLKNCCKKLLKVSNLGFIIINNFYATLFNYKFF